MLYDWDGELNDAFIAYRNAAMAYEDLAGLLGVVPPPWLGHDLQRVAGRLGFDGELDQIRSRCPTVFQAAAQLPDLGAPAGRGELVLLVENGWVASKGQSTLNLPLYESDSYDDQDRWALAIASRQRDGVVVVNQRAKVAYWLTVALPTAPRTGSEPLRVVLHDADGRAVRSVRAHHPSANAAITAEAEAGMVLLRTVARALAKYLAYNTANKESQGLGAADEHLQRGQRGGRHPFLVDLARRGPAGAGQPARGRARAGDAAGGQQRPHPGHGGVAAR